MRDRVDGKREVGGADERVQAVLTRLQAARPAMGLEERVLRGVFSRVRVGTTEVPAPFRPFRFRESVRGWRGRFAWSAAGLAALLTVASALHFEQGEVRSKGGPVVTAVRMSTAAVLTERATHETTRGMTQGTIGNNAANPANIAKETAPITSRVAKSVSLRLRTEPVERRSVRFQQTGATPFPILENRPAPPEALTEQEHLLLRLGRRHAPEELRAMTPVAQRETEVAERREYAVFFAPAFRTVEEIEAMQKEVKQ